MALEAFKAFNFRDKTLKMIGQVNTVLARYPGLRLTLRQLYYQLVVANIIPNSEKSYKSLGNLVSEARLAGLIDWDSIEDRVRVPRSSSEFNDLKELGSAALRSWRLPRWADQPEYVELWVEKDALSGVLRPLASESHITLMVNRGYSSQSAMFESANRFRTYGEDKDCHLLYLGDHDPSGEDMVRDVQDRLDMFGVSVKVEKVAITMDQIRKYKPPPNPAKMSDSRAAGYVAEHGNSSWELDAIPPDELQKIVRTAIDQHLDYDLYEACIERERKLAEKFRAAISKIKED